MAFDYDITVRREMGMKIGSGRSVVADITLNASDTPVTGGNVFTAANLNKLGMRRVDRINISGNGFYDATNKTLYPVHFLPATTALVFFESGSSGAPLSEKTDAFAASTTARIEFIGA